MYSFEVENENKKHMKAKGVPTSALKANFEFKHFEHTLNNDTTQKVDFTCIRSNKHTIYTMDLNKVALSSYDNKRFYIDKINSYAYGHYKILELKNKSTTNI